MPVLDSLGEKWLTGPSLNCVGNKLVPLDTERPLWDTE